MSRFVIRDFRESDRPLVTSSWLRSYAESPDVKRAFGRRPGHIYYEGQHRLIIRLLMTERTRVAAWSEDDDVICGWACTGLRIGPLVHYVYVQPEHRHKKVAYALMCDVSVQDERAVRVSHYSGVPMPMGWVYDPYAAWCPETYT